jgi:guanine nucleotide-binding protein subunit alpha
MQKEVKLLLLGAGASGKSTVLKQMRLINNLSWSPEEREDFRRITFSNVVGGLMTNLANTRWYAKYH